MARYEITATLTNRKTLRTTEHTTTIEATTAARARKGFADAWYGTPGIQGTAMVLKSVRKA